MFNFLQIFMIFEGAFMELWIFEVTCLILEQIQLLFQFLWSVELEKDFKILVYIT